MRSKAQIQTTETIFAVFIIIVIVVLGIVFYGRVKAEDIREQVREVKVLRIIDLAHAIANWAEMDCSIYESRDFDCVDRLKLDVVNKYLDESKSSNNFAFRYYNDLLGRSTIEVREVYSHDSSSLGYWLLFNNSANLSSRDTISVPVNIYDPVLQKYSFGIMDIKVYE
jgi:hypothetical protein